MRRSALFLLLLLLMISSLESYAWAGWEFVLERPTSSATSYMTSISGNQIAGVATFLSHRTFQEAVLWNGTAWKKLNPVGATESGAYANYGNTQVGYAIINDVEQASLWSGDASTWTSLNPTNAPWSKAFDTWNGIQVGSVGVPFGGSDASHAAYWSGSADSWVDLNPSGSCLSWANAVYGDEQVGAADYKPVLWRGSASSCVDLTPAGYYEGGVGGVYDGEQCGYAYLSGISHAGIWHDTADSWVDINPLGASDSSAADCYAGYQVGAATFDYAPHAGIWHGSSDTWTDLNAISEAYFGSKCTSGAGGIYVSNNEIWVVGDTHRSGYVYGTLWHYKADPVPEPPTYLLFLLPTSLVASPFIRKYRGQGGIRHAVRSANC